MPDGEAKTIVVRVNGASIEVPWGATVAVAMVMAQEPSRISVSGEPRMPFCGMGTCFECRCEINGEAQRRSCQVLCQPDMDIRTHG
jgi:D-hydroxyproline dehydrogenase subunit gamma